MPREERARVPPQAQGRVLLDLDPLACLPIKLPLDGRDRGGDAGDDREQPADLAVGHHLRDVIDRARHPERVPARVRSHWDSADGRRANDERGYGHTEKRHWCSPFPQAPYAVSPSRPPTPRPTTGRQGTSPSSPC